MNDSFDEEPSASWEKTFYYLLKHLHETSNAKCLLWVNPAQSDPFENILFVEEHRVRIPIRHPRFDTRTGPYLVPLDLTNKIAINLLERSVEMAWHAWSKDRLSAFCGQPIAGWVVPQASAQSLATHWASRCYIHSRQKLTKLLRFHDPSVREWLWLTFTTEQKQALLGPSKSIYSIGRKCMLQCQETSYENQLNDAMPLLQLTDKQWRQVEDYASIHAAWITWSANSRINNQEWDWAAEIFKTLEFATDYGLHDSQDRELFILHVMQLGHDFHTAKKMNSVWQKTSKGTHYGNALQEELVCEIENFHLVFNAAV